MTSRNDLERAKRGLGHAKPAFELNSGPLDPRSREAPPRPSVDGFSHWNGFPTLFRGMARRLKRGYPGAWLSNWRNDCARGRVLNFAQGAP
jgi:hypothetical protein